MLSQKWLFITVALLIAAIAIKQPALLIIAILFFLTSAVARLWSRYALQHFEFKSEISARKVFCGESITLNFTLTNNKFLPLPWVNVEQEVPEEVTFLKGNVTGGGINQEHAVFSGFFAVGWYHRLTRRYPLKCSKRGIFVFGPSRINSGDPFGFFRNVIDIDKTEYLLVYPRILPLETFSIPSRNPFGDIRIRRHLFEDPVQVMTTRDWVPGDPLKRIHWKSSARTGRLQTRVFEPTTTVDVAVFLDVRTISNQYYWNEVATDLLETAVLTATSIASYCVNNGYKFGLYANEFYFNSDRLIRLPVSETLEQFKGVLEALAQIRGVPFITIDQLISREAGQLSWETTLVVITSVPTQEVLNSITHFKKTGRNSVLILIGKDLAPVNLDGVTVYQVPEDIYQKQVETISLSKVG